MLCASHKNSVKPTHRRNSNKQQMQSFVCCLLFCSIFQLIRAKKVFEARSALNDDRLKTVKFCNPTGRDVTVYLEVTYNNIGYFMEYLEVPGLSCEELDAVVGATYFSYTKTSTVSYKIHPKILEYSFGDNSQSSSSAPMKKKDVPATKGGKKVSASYAAEIPKPLDLTTLERAEMIKGMKKRLVTEDEKMAKTRVKILAYADIDVMEFIPVYSSNRAMLKKLFSVKNGEETYLNALIGSKMYAIESKYIQESENFVTADRASKALSSFTLSYEDRLWIVIDETHPPSQQVYEYLDARKKHAAEYFAQTGRPWLHYYGPKGARNEPLLHMWPAEEIGQVHSITTTEIHWHCRHALDPDCERDMSVGRGSKPKTLTLQLEVVDTAPKVFLIRNFLSPMECEEIIKLSEPILKPSLIIQSKTSRITRTDIRSSSTAWLHRISSKILDSIYRRVGDVINVEEGKLHPAVNAEDLQVVRYFEGEYYMNHLDWGEHGMPNSRYVTILMYLTNQSSPYAGGETAFPKGNNGEGFKIHPGLGNAIMFYNILEDGNGDELAVHTALPVKQGVKWLSNLWIWDPLFKSESRT